MCFSELAKKEGVELIKNNDELFWAVMGGSPGNFGILTHVTFRPLHDKDYPDSRMMKFTIPYTAKERHDKTRKLDKNLISTELKLLYSSSWAAFLMAPSFQVLYCLYFGFLKEGTVP